MLLGFVFKETTLHSTQKRIQKYRITDMKQHLVNLQNISNSRCMQMQTIGEHGVQPIKYAYISYSRNTTPSKRHSYSGYPENIPTFRVRW
jgi:hypothetical protein